jgi:hypothetical protein
MNTRRVSGVQRVWRWTAGATLFAWVVAFAVCTTHCAFGTAVAGSGEAATPPCHAGGASDSKTDCSGNFCVTFKSLDTTGGTTTVQRTEAVTFFQPMLTALNAAELDLANSVQLLRRSRTPDIVWTPDVYPGRAHLPHGPPTSDELAA